MDYKNIVAHLLENLDTLQKEHDAKTEKYNLLDKQVEDLIRCKKILSTELALAKSKYAGAIDEMEIIKAEKDVMDDALKESVKKCEFLSTSLTRFMADPCDKLVIADVIDPPEEKEKAFVEPVGIVHVMWKEHHFYMDDDGNLYEYKHEYKLDAKPIGKWNSETKTGSWYVKLLFDKRPGERQQRLD